MSASRKPRKPAANPVFAETEGFIRRFCHLPTDADYMVATMWAIGTWTFSPAAPAMPHTYPYLYFTGAKGSGKSQLGVKVYRWITRNHEAVVDVTGPSLFRMLGDYDAESGEVIPHFPTMVLDEIDATWHGASVEGLRGPVNAGYELGATVPRAMGKISIRFPVYCPKVLIGIDNGHLPETVTDRSIRIDIQKATPEQLDALEEGPYPWDVEDEAAEIQQHLADWAKANAMVLRDYNPKRPDGIAGRQWLIARSLVQLAHAMGNEAEMTAALVEVMNREKAQRDTRTEVLTVIRDLFESMPDKHADRLLARQIVMALNENRVLPGISEKGLRNLLVKWGLNRPISIRLRPGHPGFVEGGVLGGRGYMRYFFDEAFAEYLDEGDDF